ncbi:MAG: dihydrodipicolinate synthase family protein [Actinomycetota bacterium]|nr:dihydrodipicolinate synthase family protein [Actinomycetota bacterium]
MQTIEGVYVANVTPFKEDPSYALDVDAYLEHVSWLAESGVTGIVPFGTNGEGPSLTMEEKLAVLEALFARGFPIQILPAVMEGNLPDTLRMLHFLEQYPATAVLILPPYYTKPVSDEGLKLFYEPTIAATRHPVIVYHIPKYAVPVPTEVVTDLPVWGAKDSGGETGYAETVLSAGKGVLLGTEDDLWERLSLGAQGAISALANFIPEQIVDMYSKVKTGEEEHGKALSERLKRVRAGTKEYTSAAVLKKLARARHGVSMGTVRPPLTPAPAEYDPNPTLQLAEAARI